MITIVHNLNLGLHFLATAIGTILFVVFVPWRINHAPLHALLNATDQQDNLTIKWSDAKLGELNFVGITCALITGVASSALSWPSANDSPWFTTAAWCSSIVMSLTAIGSATQQTLYLHRLSCYINGPERLRLVLGYEGSKNPKKWNVRPMQLFVWQIPVMLLNFSILLFVAGLMNLLQHKAYVQSWQVSSTDTRIFIIVGLSATFSLLSYLVGMSNLYYQVGSRNTDDVYQKPKRYCEKDSDSGKKAEKYSNQDRRVKLRAGGLADRGIDVEALSNSPSMADIQDNWNLS